MFDAGSQGVGLFEIWRGCWIEWKAGVAISPCYSMGTIHSMCWGVASVSSGSNLFSTDEDANRWKSEPVVQPSAILDSAKPLISLSVID